MRKHRFPCGHLGRGKDCHRCQAAADLEHASKRATGEEQANMVKEAQRLRTTAVKGERPAHVPTLAGL